MKRRDIYDAFDSIRPDQAAKDRMLKNILSQASDSQPAGKDVTMRNYHKKPLMIAATIALAVLLMGCAVVAMNLDDLIFNREEYIANPLYSEDGTKIPATEKIKNQISVVGVDGSKNQMAMQEWLDYKKEYDPDGMKAKISDFVSPKQYSDYYAYTQELVDKVDEICQKYGLKLNGDNGLALDYNKHFLTDAIGIETVFQDHAPVQAEYHGGRFYESGNFALDYYVTMQDERAQQEYSFFLHYSYHDKDYFSPGFLTIEDAQNAQQWNYTLANGTDVLIVCEKNDETHILYDREDAFISISFRNVGDHWDSPSEVMSHRDMELVAEMMDYSLKPKPVENMAEIKAQMLENAQNYELEQQRLMEEAMVAKRKEYEENELQDSFADLVCRMRDHEEYFTKYSNVEFRNFWETMEYVLMDVTGDGKEELILGKDGEIKNIWIIREGKTYHMAGAVSEGYLCEGNVFAEYNFMDGSPNYFFLHFDENGFAIRTISLTYHVAVGKWGLQDSEEGESLQWITEEKAMEIINSYVRLDLDWKPVSEFPMN